MSRFSCAISRVLVAMALSAPVEASDSRAADYPSRPIRLVAPFVPGGGTDLIARLIGEIGFEIVGSTPEQFASLIREEIVKWTKVVRDAGIKPE